MVRREEHPWRTRATIFLDTRAAAHQGEGPASSFEWAVSASASMACHLALRGYAVRVVDADGEWLRPGTTGNETMSGPEAEGPLLDVFATVGLTEGRSPAVRDPQARARVRDGLLVAVLGDLEGDQAETVAALRHGNASALALVLDTSAWASRSSAPADGRTTRAAALLAAAGWRVTICGPQTDLAEAWQALARSGTLAGGGLRR